MPERLSQPLRDTFSTIVSPPFYQNAETPYGSHISLFPFRAGKVNFCRRWPSKRVTMDNITALKPAMADVGPPAELPSNEHTIEPLDLLEDPKVRTKLRIYAILVALYVHYVLALGEHQLANETSSSSSSS